MRSTVLSSGGKSRLVSKKYRRRRQDSGRMSSTVNAAASAVMEIGAIKVLSGWMTWLVLASFFADLVRPVSLFARDRNSSSRASGCPRNSKAARKSRIADGASKDVSGRRNGRVSSPKCLSEAFASRFALSAFQLKILPDR